MMRKLTIVITVIIICFSIFRCNNNPSFIHWSVSKHSDTTGKHYQYISSDADSWEMPIYFPSETIH